MTRHGEMKRSAGLLMFRRTTRGIEVLLGHPGGPFWLRKDDHSWTIPKGAIDPGETPLDAAVREFREETGFEPSPPYVELPSIRMRSGKTVVAWAFEGDCDPARLESNPFSCEWPPRSGRFAEYPELDRVAWFSFEDALRKITPSQAPFIEALQTSS